MKKFQKFTEVCFAPISIILLAVIAFSSVFAADSEMEVLSNNPTQGETTVTYSQGSSFTVIVPKKIAISDGKSASFSVSAKGDILGSDIVVVTADKRVQMKNEEGKKSIVANVNMYRGGRTPYFSCSDLALKDTNGINIGTTWTDNNIYSPNKLTAGNWSGNFHFHIDNGIKLEDTSKLVQSGNTYIVPATVEENGISHRVALVSFANKDLSQKSIEISEGVRIIDRGAFNDTGISNIHISKTVTSIGEDAFNICGLLTAINVDNDNEFYSSADGVLYNKDKTTLICYPRNKGGDNTGITQGTTEYTVPEGVTFINTNAFINCKWLTKINLPDSLEAIDYSVVPSDFKNSENENIVVTYKGNSYTTKTDLDAALKANGVNCN